MRQDAWRAPALTAALAVGAAGLVTALDPATRSLFAACPFHLLTGGWCPLCGGTRAVAALGRGDLGTALDYNVLVVLAVPVVVVLWARWLWQSVRPRRLRPAAASSRPVLLVVALVVAAVFWVLRNLPAFSMLAP